MYVGIGMRDPVSASPAHRNMTCQMATSSGSRRNTNPFRPKVVDAAVYIGRKRERYNPRTRRCLARLLPTAVVAVRPLWFLRRRPWEPRPEHLRLELRDGVRLEE